VTPETRAAADRVILDVANVKYLAMTLGKGDLDRRCEATGWTIRQTIGHLAASLQVYGEALPRMAAAVGAAEEPFDWDVLNAETARRTAATPLPALLDALSRGRDATIEALLALSEQDLAQPVTASVPLRAVIAAWMTHLSDHAIDFADALPLARFDPMLLNWVLHADYSTSAPRLARQQQLMAEVRVRLATMEEE